MDFRDIGIGELAQRVRSGEQTAEEVLRSTLARIETENPRLNAFVALLPEAELLGQARAVDAAVARGEDPGLLAGVPVGVKDLEDVAGLRTTLGSALRGGIEPSARDSLQIRRMRAAGAIIVGKTNTPEYGCKGVTDNPLFGFTRNPWNPDHSPGGSSGGSSSALAAGLVPLATGSDGGGSIRIPAAMCGHSGFKASQGRVPMVGSGGADHRAARGPRSHGPVAAGYRHRPGRGQGPGSRWTSIPCPTTDPGCRPSMPAPCRRR
ncbi:MAG: amidase [Gammaproteobacteria bacterium]|nr:amidase [Gammaproteobacteria bacterium]